MDGFAPAVVEHFNLSPVTMPMCVALFTRTRVTPQTMILPAVPELGVSWRTPSTGPPKVVCLENVVAEVVLTSVYWLEAEL